MKAGREMDALVAEKVMGREVTANVGGFERGSGWHDDYGFTRSRHPRNPPYTFGDKLEESNANYERVPFYSTNISAAWEVVEKMRERALCVTLEWTITDGWDFSITPHDFPYEFCIKENASSIPLAICLAALKAVE